MTTIKELAERRNADTEYMCDLVRMIRAEGSRGMTSADITRLTGSNQYRLLAEAEKLGAVRSNPTGMRSRGRRWYAPEFYPGEF